jgi:transposase, IS5 family
LWEPKPGEKKPRTYRNQARQNDLRLARNKRPGYKLIRKTIRKQLAYLFRNLKSIETLSVQKALNEKQRESLKTLRMIYAQQQGMYETRTHKVEDRMVSVRQPWVRPIVRGKIPTGTEFGAKIAISVDGGYSRIEKFPLTPLMNLKP